MKPNKELIIFGASYGAAQYDTLLTLPNPDSLEIIKRDGLEAQLPSWYNFEKETINQKRFSKNVLSILSSCYLLPKKFQNYSKKERQGKVALFDSANPFRFFEQIKEYLLKQRQKEEQYKKHIEATYQTQAFNYLLVKEILSCSPKGKVTPLVYKMSVGRTSQKLGIETIAEMDRRELEFVKDPVVKAYWSIISQQVRQKYEGYIEDLPILEAVIDKEHKRNKDFSKFDVRILHKVDSKGRHHLFPPDL